MAIKASQIAADGAGAGQGPQDRCARADLHHRHGGRLDRPRLQPGGHLFFVVARSVPAPCRLAPVHPHAALLDRLQEMNKYDPDCGTTFTWATRAFGPKTGWAGGWGNRGRQHAGHGQPGPGGRASTCSSWSRDRTARSVRTRTAAGCCSSASLWIVAMTVICYIGIEVSAKLPEGTLLGIEVVMLLVLSITAFVKVFGSPHPAAYLRPAAPELVPALEPHAARQAFIGGLILMLFIYWGSGHRSLGQRGDQGQGHHAGPGRRHLHSDPARRLRRW